MPSTYSPSFAELLQRQTASKDFNEFTLELRPTKKSHYWPNMFSPCQLNALHTYRGYTEHKLHKHLQHHMYPPQTVIIPDWAKPNLVSIAEKWKESWGRGRRQLQTSIVLWACIQMQGRPPSLLLSMGLSAQLILQLVDWQQQSAAT